MSQPLNPVFTPEYDHLRSVLVRLRLETGLTQSELAARLGRTQAHVNLLEKGQRRVDILEFYNFVTALDQAPSEIAEEVFAGFRQVKAEACAAPGTT